MRDSVPAETPEDPPHTEDRAYRPGALAEVLRILDDFHAKVDADRAAGRKPSLSEYLAQFPGHEDIIRDDWRRMREEDPPVRVSATPLKILENLMRSGTRRLDESREIARGGMGVVYRQRDELLGRDLALKVGLGSQVPLDGAGTVSAGPALRRMLQEAQITAQLSHPGVVPVHELGIDRDGRLFFTMKLVRGRTLRDVFRLVREKREGWTVSRALQVLIRICETVAFAHSKGVIHRDIKPANVMVGSFGEVYVMDWGVAKVLGDPAAEDLLSLSAPSPPPSPGPWTRSDAPEPLGLTRAGDVVGTPEYMSPEQASGRIDSMDHRTDVYSLGALLYELLAARAPYEDPSTPRTPILILRSVMGGPPVSLAALAPGTPEQLKAVCEKAMARDPKDRYPTAESLANDLHRFLEGRVVLAYRSGPLVEFRTWVRRNSAVAGTVAAAMAILVAIVSWVAVQRSLDAEVIRGERDAARAAGEREKAAHRRARGLLFAARAAALVPKDPALALQLAVQAADLAPGPDASDALQAALARHHERRRLIGHDSYVNEGHWSADGRRILTREWGEGAILWDADTGKPISRFIGDEEVFAAALSTDGRFVATVGREGSARIWDATRGTVIRALEGHEGTARAVGFSPDGALLATAGDDGTVRLWPVEGRGDAKVLRGGGIAVGDFAWLPDGRRLLTIEQDGACRLWDAGTGEVLQAFGSGGKPSKTERTRLVLADGGRLVAAFGPGSLFRLYSLVEGPPVLLAERPRCYPPVVSGDGKRIGIHRRSQDDEAAVFEVFDAADPGRGRTVPLEAVSLYMALDRTGRRVAACVGYEIKVLDVDSGRTVASLCGHRYDLKGVAWSPDDRRLLSFSADMTARIWDPETPDAVRLPAPPAVASPDGMRVAEPEAGPDGRVATVAIRDRDGTGEPVRFPVPPPLAYLSWLHDGSHLAAVGGDRVDIVDSRTGAITGSAPLPEAVVGLAPRMEVSVDLRRACIPDGKGYLAVTDLSTGKRLSSSIPSRVSCAMSPDGARVVTADGADATATVWDAETGKAIRTLTGHTGWVLHVDWSPDGERVATSAMESKVRIWDARTWAPVAVIAPVPMRNNIVRFGDGHRWLSVETGNEVLLYSGDGGDRVATLAPATPPRSRGVYGPFLPGCVALVAGDPPVVRLWPLDPLPVARARLPVETEPSVVRTYELLEGGEADAYEEAWLRRHPTARAFALKGISHARKGNLDAAIQWVEAARILHKGHAEPSWGEACVRAARAAALPAGPARSEETSRAFEALGRAIARDPTRVSLARNEPLLEPLRADPRWGPLVKE